MSRQPHHGGRGRFQSPANRIRKNDRIRAREVRLIGPDSKMIGIVTREEALQAAKNYGLDLVEISALAKPPVCRILDFGKYMYEQSKRSKEKHHTTKVKIIKFKVRIDTHDFMVKLRRAEEFLYKGNKVKMTLQFRGREMEHTEIGFEVVNRALSSLAHVATSDGEPKLAGRNILASLSPLPANKRKLKFNEEISEEDAPDDSGDEGED